MEPDVRELPYGGWLATSKTETALRIGVIGASEVDAKKLFDESVARWKELSEAQEA